MNETMWSVGTRVGRRMWARGVLCGGARVATRVGDRVWIRVTFRVGELVGESLGD